jgi:hypothetical protein
VTPQRFAPTLLASVALGAPFVLAAHAASALVAPLTTATVAALLRVTAPLSSGASVEIEPGWVAEGKADEPAALVIDAVTKVPAKHSGTPPRKLQAPALFVSEATVLKLAQSAARPRGSFVAATSQHPAGLRLSGVAALGIGLQDGDILIEALGIAPHAAAEIIGAILEARAKQARFLSGSIWRQGQIIRITVEQPYIS